jgi:tRNA A-37 threonylcarbamoyl transferase component Bud32
MKLPPRIGRYRIVELLGQGAMGVVYRGRDEGLDRDAAVKVIRGEALDDESRAMFQKEARAAARLQHPNIVTVYEMGEEEGAPYLAMELLAGHDLQRAMRDRSFADPLAALAVTEQVLAGLGHAHARGIVHRDMKPSNVFVHDGAHVKVLDFGVARLGEALTVTGRVVGTPHYMAPEQVRADQVDGRTDLFAAALMFYEMVTGAKAYRAGSAVSVMFQIVHEDADLSRLPPTPRGEALRRVLRRALARDREERHPNAAALAADLATAVRSYEGETAFPQEPPVLGETLMESALPAIEEVPPAVVVPAPVPVAAAPAGEPELELSHADEVPAGSPDWERPSPQLAVATKEALPRNPAPSSANAPGAVASFVATVLVGLALAGAGVWWWTARAPRAVDHATPPATADPSEPTPTAAGPTRTAASAPAVVPSVPTPAAAPSGTPASRPPVAATPRAPVDVPGRLQRAEALFEAGHLTAALAEARAVLKAAPDHEAARYLQDDILLDLAVEQHLKRAYEALSAGDPARARREAEAGLALKPTESRLATVMREIEGYRVQ